MGALYDALLEGKITEESARKAAEEVAAYDQRLAAVDTRLTLLTWMVSFLTALALANLWLSVSILGRLPH